VPSFRSLVAASPRLYCLAARSRRGRNRRVVDRHTDLVVEGFPRSGNTYVVAWLSLARPTLRVASHVHHLAHVRRAQQLGVPVLVLVRPPRDAVLSNLVFRPEADPSELLGRWLEFYDPSVLTRARTVIATFDEATGDMATVLGRVERETGLPGGTYVVPDPEAVLDRVQELGDRRFGSVPDSKLARPSQTRDALKEAAAHRVDAPAVAGLLRAAEARFRALTG
jgi:hypothetical protein